MSKRFGELKETRVFIEFSKVKVKGSLEEYMEKFLELKSHLLMFQKENDDECYFINSFISGLTEDKRQCFLIYIPNTLARMHEATADGATKRNRTQNRTHT